MVDISYFLHSSVLPEVASHNHSSLLQYYHRAHTEAIKSFGMHGYEMEMEDLLTEYHSVQVFHWTIGKDYLGRLANNIVAVKWNIMPVM